MADQAPAFGSVMEKAAAAAVRSPHLEYMEMRELLTVEAEVRPRWMDWAWRAEPRDGAAMAAAAWRAVAKEASSGLAVEQKQEAARSNSPWWSKPAANVFQATASLSPAPKKTAAAAEISLEHLLYISMSALVT